MKAEWLGKEPDNGVLEVENSQEFYRLWSALSFLFNCDGPASATTGWVFEQKKEAWMKDDDVVTIDDGWCVTQWCHFTTGWWRVWPWVYFNGDHLGASGGTKGEIQSTGFLFPFTKCSGEMMHAWWRGLPCPFPPFTQQLSLPLPFGHVLQEYENSCVLGKDDKVGKVDQGIQTATDNFIQRAKRQRVLIREIFALMDRWYPLEEETNDLLIFKPPKQIPMETPRWWRSRMLSS